MTKYAKKPVATANAYGDEQIRKKVSNIVHDEQNLHIPPGTMQPTFLDQQGMSKLVAFIKSREHRAAERADIDARTDELSHWVEFFKDPRMNAMTPSQRLQKRIDDLYERRAALRQSGKGKK